MPFLVRRGTDSQRLTITPAEGEILYTTDTKNVFVGDGTTLGGNQITGTFAGGTLSSDLSLSTHSITNNNNLTINGATGSISAATVTANIQNSKLSIVDNTITVTDNTVPLRIVNENPFAVQTFSTTDGTIPGTAKLTINAHKGTYNSPQDTVANDWLHTLEFLAYNGGNYQSASAIVTSWGSDADFSSSSPRSVFNVITGNNSSYNILTFDGYGVLTAPVFKAASYATSALPPSPEEGWIVYDSTSHEFKGWNGTTWAVLG
jgi:Major tropism determinant N-terminal domain